MSTWIYLDSAGLQQGPFEEQQIRLWIEQGFFPGEIMAKKSDDEENFRMIKTIDEFKTMFSDKDLQKVETTPSDKKSEKLEQTRLGQTNSAKQNENEKIKDESKDEIEKKMSNFIGDYATIGPPPESKELHWLYIDSNGKIQGPFSNSLMHFWYNEGHFDENLRVMHYNRPINKSIPNNPKNLILSNFMPIRTFVSCDFIKNVTDYERLYWFYLDEENVEQGPYRSKTMLKWLQRGFLPPNLKVRSDISREFVPMEQLTTPFGNQFPEIPSWSYFDDDGVEYGPFLTSIMAMWYFQGFFRKNTMVKNRKFGDIVLTVYDARMHFTKNQEETMNQLNVPVLKTPISKKTSDQWFFIDLDNQKEQGPFSSEAMKHWFEKGFLPDFIKVRRTEESSFVAINQRSDCDFIRSKLTPISFPSHNQISQFSQSAFQLQSVNKPNPVKTEPNWYYMGSNDKEYGPFPSSMMRQWWFSQQLRPDLLVREESEQPHMARPIRDKNCCFKFLEPEHMDNVDLTLSRFREKKAEKAVLKNIEVKQKVSENLKMLTQTLDSIDMKK